MTERQQRKAKLSAFNVSRANAKGLIKGLPTDAEINFGGHTFLVDEGTLLEIDGQEILGTSLSSDGHLLINLRLFDSANKLIFEVVLNEWIAHTKDIWDLSFHHKTLKINDLPRSVGLEIDMGTAEYREYRGRFTFYLKIRLLSDRVVFCRSA